MKTKLLSNIILFLLIANPGISQDFRNLDFEYGVYKAQPRKWAIEGEGESYSARLDSINYQNGSKSLYVTLKDAQVFIFFPLPGQLIAGKTIQIDAYIKSLDGDSLQTMLLFHNPNSGKPISSEPSRANGEWKVISHKASFPDNYSSDRLLVAIMTVGSGSFWLDNVNIRIDGKEYGKGSPDFREPTESEIATLNKSAIPIESFESNSRIESLIGNAKIVALGENSHGSASIYKFKLQMVKYLVINKGFRTFALESPTVEADKINEYVLNEKGTTKDVLKYLIYPSWQTQELLDIILWIKSYNRSTSDKVEFRGFDMQDGTTALNELESFAEGDSILLTDLNKLKTMCETATPGEKKWNEVFTLADKINESLKPNEGSDHHISTLESEMLKHYLRIFLQSFSLKHGIDNKTRDDYMAENIEWLSNHSGNAGRIIVSADNTHVTKASGKMGHLLKAKFDDDYMVIGITYKIGTYSAYGPEKYYEVHPPYVGTYEYFFSKCDYKNYILDIIDSNDIDILNMPAGFRSIGSRPQETTQFTEINLKSHFDAIVYLEHSEHTTLLTGQ